MKHQLFTRYSKIGSFACFTNPNNRNAKDENGWTALMYAANYQLYSLVEMLVSKGADITLTNDEGETALDLAKDAVKYWVTLNPQIKARYFQSLEASVKIHQFLTNKKNNQNNL